MMEVVMERGRRRAPLHLKVVAYHGDHVRAGDELPLELFDLKTVLIIGSTQYERNHGRFDCVAVSINCGAIT